MASFAHVIYVMGLLVYAEAYYNGAAHSSCQSFDPGSNHGSQGTGATPYQINIPTATSYTDGQQITVEITGDVFTGIILQARKKDGSDWTPIGWFSVPLNSSGLRLMTCVSSGDTITQKTGFISMNSMLITWIAPNYDAGEIEFKANVFKDKLVWYNNVKSSKSLKYSKPETTTTSSTTTQSGLTTTTTPYYFPTLYPNGSQTTHTGTQIYLGLLLATLMKFFFGY